jgi:phosphatidate cytidylyltransferase
MTETEEVKPTKSQIFVRRLCSSLFLYGVLMVGLFGANDRMSLLAFGSIVILLGVLALNEFYEMARKGGCAPFENLGQVASLALLGGSFWSLAVLKDISLAQDIELIVLLVLGPVAGIAQLRAYSEGKKSIGPLASTLFGVVYVALLLNVLQKIRYFPDLEGQWWLLFFIIVSKMSDTGAYCIGSLIGKSKMIPSVSPGKTWEGFVGGIIFSVISAWIFHYFAGGHFASMPLSHALILAGLLGVGSVTGDLVESLFKRQADMKDSGQFFPGVGGILDLLDSLLFNAPIMYIYLKYILPS